MLRDEDSLFEIFIEDLLEQISYFDACILAMERNSLDLEAMNTLFRVFHSLKGLFFTMEYQSLGEYFHRLESYVQFRKENKQDLDQEFLDLVIDLRETLEAYIATLKSDHDRVFDLERYEASLGELEESSIRPKVSEGSSQAIQHIVPPRQLLYEALKRTELIYLQMIDSERKVIDPKLLKDAFEDCLKLSAPLNERKLKDLFQSACRFLEYYVRKELRLDHLSEGLIMETFDWAMRLIDLTKPLNQEDERNLMVHLDMMQAQRIMYLQQLSEDSYSEPDRENQKLGEILVKQGVVNEAAIEAIISKQKTGGVSLKLGEALVSENMVRVKDIAGALQVQNQLRKQSDNYTFIRIPERKVDILVDGMEELMIMQTQLKEKLRKRWMEDDMGTKLQLDRIDRMLILLQHQAMSFRLQSLENTLKKVEIIGRSTAKDLGKDVCFQLEGTDIEVNRSIIERLQNPILHLVRNAIYHGIETPEVRESQGKSRMGQLKVTGQIDKSHLTINISDDGSGLDLGRILERAKSVGLAEPDRDYAPWEIIDFIFEPGFSTLEEAGTVSGRGLGMNIVETEIKALGGHIEIQNHPQDGVSFMLKVPLHAENLLGMLVSIGDEKLIVPSEYLVETVHGKAVEWVIMSGECDKVIIGGNSMPLIPIASLLEQQTSIEDFMSAEVMVLSYEGVKRALPIMKCYKEIGVFVNTLEDFKENRSIFQGVAVISEIEFALILDVPKLFSF